MKIFYYGYEQWDIPLIASCIHLNKFSPHRTPTVKEVCNVYRGLKIEPDTLGIPLFLGKDEHQNEIYAVGFGKNSLLALQAVTFLNPRGTDWKFYSTVQERNILLILGSFFINRLRLINPGIRLTALGARKSYLRLVKLVENIKELNRVG